MTAVVAVKTRVIFTRKEVQQKTDSGIILSNPNQEHNPLGYVHSIGDKVDIAGLAVGDAISVNWQSVGMLEHDNTKYYIVDQSNINAIIR